jgi:hypothetical protein
MILRDREQKAGERGGTPRGSRLSGGRHAGSIRRSTSASQDRRRKPHVVPNKIAAAARELHAHRAKGAEDHYLRSQQHRIRQQARLPIINWRQKRREAGDHEKLSQDPQGEETEQDPKQCRHVISLSGSAELLLFTAATAVVSGFSRTGVSDEAESSTYGGRRV